MIVNSISGVSVNANLPMLFREFEEERCYIAFARYRETWGISALVNIAINPNQKLSNILPTTSSTGSVESVNRFVDRMCASSYDIENEENTKVRIYKTAGSVADFSEDMNNYFSINDAQLIDTNLYLEHINNYWCLIKGLPNDYSRFMNNDNGDKFYLVTRQEDDSYPDHPNAYVKMVKIQPNNITLDFASISEPVTLWVKDGGVTESLVIRNLTRQTNILGEQLVSGIPSNFYTDVTENELLGWAYNTNYNINPDSGGNTYFFLKNFSSSVVSDRWYMMKYDLPESSPNAPAPETVWFYDASGRKYLLFKNIDQKKNITYVKVAQDVPSGGLAIFHESLPFAFPPVNSNNDVSDANPPNASLNYLKNAAFHKSLFEVLGYVKIKKSYNPNSTNPNEYSSRVAYCRELTTSAREATQHLDKQKYLQLGFVENDPSSTKRIENITITSPEPVHRFGNVRPNPTGLAFYPSSTVRLYMWANDFIVGDKVVIKLNPVSGTTEELVREIREINFVENYIVINQSLGDGKVLYPSLDNGNLDLSTAQIVTDPTNINNVISVVEYAVCDNYVDALTYEMDSVMLDVKIPNTGDDLYDGTYRQFAVVNDPSVMIYDDTGVGALTKANKTDSLYLKTNMSPVPKTDLFIDGQNSVNHAYEPGLVLYLANKQQLVRKYLNRRETFKLVL